MAPLFTGLKFGFGRSAEVAGPSAPSFATGGTVTTPGDGFSYHVFTAPGTFTVSGGPGSIQYLAVGGGGGGGDGGDSTGGGGGAGGLVYNSSYNVTNTSYPLGVGGGGGCATNGSNTTAFGITALGGGYGSSRFIAPGPGAGAPGGCGGSGGSYSGPVVAGGGTGTQPSQNPGVPNLTQYGNPGLAAGQPGGSANAPNSSSVNATFPDSSTILSGSPIGPQSIGRGGAPLGGSQWPETSYGSGGLGGLNSGPGNFGPGLPGAIIIRYPS